MSYWFSIRMIPKITCANELIQPLDASMYCDRTLLIISQPTNQPQGCLINPALPLRRVLRLRKTSPLHNLLALSRTVLRLLHLGHRRRRPRPPHRFQRYPPHHCPLRHARLLRILMAHGLPLPRFTRLRRRRQPPRRWCALFRVPARRTEQSAHAAECMVARRPAGEQLAGVVVHWELACRPGLAMVHLCHRYHYLGHVCHAVLYVPSL